MHNIGDRLLYLLIGMAIGFVCGYIVSRLRCEDGETVDDENKKLPKDAGIVRYPMVFDIALAIVFLLTVYSAFQAQIASNHSNDALEHQRHSDMVACQNSNDFRTANLELWNFVLDLSIADPRNQDNPREVRYLHRIQTWISQIYRQHDCSDLSKKYPIPPSPKIIVFRHHPK